MATAVALASGDPAAAAAAAVHAAAAVSAATTVPAAAAFKTAAGPAVRTSCASRSPPLPGAG